MYVKCSVNEVACLVGRKVLNGMTVGSVNPKITTHTSDPQKFINKIVFD